jgi:hypothetical protein
MPITPKREIEIEEELAKIDAEIDREMAKISLKASSPALAAETSANRLPARTVIDTPLQRIIAQSSPELAPRTLAISLPYSSLERDFRAGDWRATHKR